MIDPVDHCEDATAEGERQYLKVGASAVEVLAGAMMLARLTQLPGILDLAADASRGSW